MHVTVTRVNTRDEPIENATIVAEEMVRWLRGIDGFEGMVMLSRPGTSVGMTFWQSREIADRHRVARMEFVKRMTATAAVEVEESVDYELTYADVGPLSTDSAP